MIVERICCFFRSLIVEFCCCVLSGVCYWLFVVCCSLCGLRCVLFVVGCSLFLVWCSLFCRLLFVVVSYCVRALCIAGWLVGGCCDFDQCLFFLRVVGCWWLVIGGWLLVYWLFVDVFWLMVGVLWWVVVGS